MSYKTVLVALNEINRLDALTAAAAKIASLDGAFVRGLYTIPAAQICSSVLDSIRVYRGSNQDQDDVTVMVVKTS